MIKKILLFSLAMILMVSCEKDANDLENHFEVTIEGEVYSDDSFITGSGYSTSIDSKDGFEDFITTVYTPFGDFEAYLLHYSNVSDFKPIEGSYKIAQKESDANYNDKSLLLWLSSSSTGFYSLNSNGVNNITSVKEISSNSSEITYLITGNFNCTFSNGNSTLSITGKYKFPIEIINR